MRHMLRLWKEESGQDLVEYALVAMLISLLVVAAVKTLGKVKSVK